MKSRSKHHDTDGASAPGDLQARIERFLGTCGVPALLEYGDDLLPLMPGQYALEIRSGRLWIEAWNEQRSVCRRLLSIEKIAPGMLDCTIHRFAGVPGKLTFLDTARPQTTHRQVAGERGSFAEQFRRLLARQFPGWQTHTLTTGMDLQRSLSPVYPRARLTRGNHQIAAMACPDPESEPGLLTFALIWFDHVRRYCDATRLCLFLPDRCGALTAQRLRWLDNKTISPRIFRYNESGLAGEVDIQDLGNIQTRVSSSFRTAQHPTRITDLFSDLWRIDGVGICPELNGQVSIRCRGKQFACVREGRLFLGLREPVETTAADVLAFATHMSALDSSIAGSHPERWLECAVRREPERVYPTLRKNLLHSQVLTFAGCDRDQVDLLGITDDGQFAVLELKAEEDIHLPLQALDYWTRINWHRERGELAPLFPGAPTKDVSPLLLLVAPALSFHPAATIVLRYFSQAVHVERVGVNVNWQHGLQVVMRLRGAASPQSQGNYEYLNWTSEH